MASGDVGKLDSGNRMLMEGEAVISTIANPDFTRDVIFIYLVTLLREEPKFSAYSRRG